MTDPTISSSNQSRLPAPPRPLPGSNDAVSQRRLRVITPELEDLFANAPPWLASLVLHMCILIVLGLTILTTTKRATQEMQAVYGEKLGDQLLDNSVDLSTPTPDPTADKAVYSPADLPPVSDPLATPKPGALDIPLMASPFAPASGQGYTGAMPDVPIGLALTGREKGMKVVLLKAFGGNATTEDAVHRALEWLKRNQRSDGSWNLRSSYADGGGSDNPAAATAMALLAFQGDGSTHVVGEYKQVVKKGWDYLLKTQSKEGQFKSAGAPTSHELYTHALATIAVCELYGMTADSAFRGPAERAIQFCVKYQSREGGWRYQPDRMDSDTSVSGWFSMALQSARMAKLDVPPATLENLSRYLDSAQADEGASYCYRPGSPPTLSMTAEGLLCREYLGWSHNDPRLVAGVKMLANNPIKLSDYQLDPYYWYYATQVLHHFGGEPWKRWNEIMRQLVPEMQIKKGAEAGSWDPTNCKFGSEGGRLYVTCLQTYMLEVYYRHLPLYNNIFLQSGHQE